MQITKADFTRYVKFTVNIHDNDINPYIQEAIRFLPRIRSDIYYQLLALPAITFTSWQLQTSTPVAEWREYQGKLYQAQETTTLAPDTPADGVWREDALQTIFHFYLKPYLVFKAYESFLLVHGINVTPAGLTETQDNTYDHISDKRRAEFMTSLKKNVLFYYDQLMAALKANNYLDQVEDCKPKVPGVGVYVLGKKHKRGCGCGCDERGIPPRLRPDDYGTFDKTYPPSFD